MENRIEECQTTFHQVKPQIILNQLKTQNNFAKQKRNINFNLTKFNSQPNNSSTTKHSSRAYNIFKQQNELQEKKRSISRESSCVELKTTGNITL